ncbi:hypothetical protein [Natrinema sp. SYSU A 869]|nr:hypothetical protein [Natrinema sp. SYSU A 869]
MAKWNTRLIKTVLTEPSWLILLIELNGFADRGGTTTAVAQ